MYPECVLCAAAFSSNGALASLPVGRVVVFNERYGQVWILCTRCGFWNLVPLEERCEILEECSNLLKHGDQEVVVGHHAAALHTGSARIIGLGIENLQHGRRHTWWRARAVQRRVVTFAALRLAAVGGVATAGMLLQVPLWIALLIGLIGMVAVFTLGPLVRRRVVATVIANSGHRIRVEEGALRSAQMWMDEEKEISLRVLTPAGEKEFYGISALRLVLLAMQKLNRKVEFGDYSSGRQLLLRHEGKLSRILHVDWPSVDDSTEAPSLLSLRRASPPTRVARPLSQYPSHVRIAIELYVLDRLHAELVGRNLEDLTALSASWMELAEIADDLTLPSSVHDHLQRLRKSATVPFDESGIGPT